MAKWVCTVCGYVYEGEQAPEACPVCKAPASKFQKQEGELSWAAEHVVGVAKGVSEDILADLRANFDWHESFSLQKKGLQSNNISKGGYSHD